MNAIVWFRNDLRLHDHEPLVRALENKHKHVLFVYCLDPRHFLKTQLCGFPRTGSFRAQFLFESLADLRTNLKKLGSDLLIARGVPEKVLPQIAASNAVSHIYYHQEAATEELRVEKALAENLKSAGVQLRPSWGSTLYHIDDLPFEVSRLPAVFTQFRIACEKNTKIRPPLTSPESLPPTVDVTDFGAIPTLEEVGLTNPGRESRSVLPFMGGETAGLNRINQYFWESNSLKVYKQTRNGLLGPNYSSKFAPWLAHGCISPRFVAAEVARYERDVVQNESTYWLVFELIWRDFFRFLALQAGPLLFHRGGPRRLNGNWQMDSELLSKWIHGDTGIPFVDANMRELLLTGFMSNRGRQNVASFLAKNLGIDWRAGAEWFESQLIDYDVCSNWGNWAYVAGVGSDPRQDRYFNVIKQAWDYDPHGKYVKTWLPELADLPTEFTHEPWKRETSGQTQLGLGFRESTAYPSPIIDLQASYDQLRLKSNHPDSHENRSFADTRPRRNHQRRKRD